MLAAKKPMHLSENNFPCIEMGEMAKMSEIKTGKSQINCADGWNVVNE